MKKLLIILPSIFVAAAAMANPGFYAGGLIGETHVNVNTSLYGFNYLGTTNESTNAGVGDVFVGYSFTNMFAVEAGGMNMRKGSTNSVSAEYVAVKGTAPIDKQFTLHGKVGVFNSNVKGSNAGLLVAAGADYKVTPSFGIGPEFIWMRQGLNTNNGWNIIDTTVTFSTIGLQATYAF